MGPQTTRPFRISDALVLVAATCIGMAGCKAWVAAVPSWSSILPTSPEPWLAWLWRASQVWGPFAIILLLCWTSAVLLLRLLPTRPPLRHLWSQPGFLACVAALFTFAWKLAGIGLGFIISFVMTNSGLKDLSWPEIVRHTLVRSLVAFDGATMLFAWLALWASGHWRAEPNWVDRTGRVLGVAWIAVAFLVVWAGI